MPTKHFKPRIKESCSQGFSFIGGGYAVPAAGSEWYPRNMYNKGNSRTDLQYHTQQPSDLAAM